ncbi:unnamed protein product [Vitrella brassicaformis CCMP3155]|uniref:GT23 domain-containing protein n=1 Tax=Vitrella brassicaformis (strain CCMP3155) TaxID=1169540 RepID=A0A0G4EHX1_VITBC|nr:unnamed protein product [Vitrella brassicaformis CCMP3155]|eukprot:CEL95529.1 unnamed protein product [Vitrella brassicaformis CCMP3155]
MTHAAQLLLSIGIRIAFLSLIATPSAHAAHQLPVGPLLPSSQLCSPATLLPNGGASEAKDHLRCDWSRHDSSHSCCDAETAVLQRTMIDQVESMKTVYGSPIHSVLTNFHPSLDTNSNIRAACLDAVKELFNSRLAAIRKALPVIDRATGFMAQAADEMLCRQCFLPRVVSVNATANATNATEGEGQCIEREAEGGCLDERSFEYRSGVFHLAVLDAYQQLYGTYTAVYAETAELLRAARSNGTDDCLPVAYLQEITAGVQLRSFLEDDVAFKTALPFRPYRDLSPPPPDTSPTIEEEHDDFRMDNTNSNFSSSTRDEQGTLKQLESYRGVISWRLWVGRVAGSIFGGALAITEEILLMLWCYTADVGSAFTHLMWAKHNDNDTSGAVPRAAWLPPLLLPSMRETRQYDTAVIIGLSNRVPRWVVDRALGDVVALLKANQGGVHFIFVEDSIPKKRLWRTLTATHMGHIANATWQWNTPHTNSTVTCVWRRHHHSQIDWAQIGSLYAANTAQAVSIDLHALVNNTPTPPAHLFSAPLMQAIPHTAHARRLTQYAPCAVGSTPLHPLSDDMCTNPLDVLLADYAARHSRFVGTVRAAGRTAEGDGAYKWPAGEAHTKALVYTCTSVAQCGGNGDRLNGIIQTFLLAVLSGRLFFLHHRTPIMWSRLWVPNRVDWRVAGGAVWADPSRHNGIDDVHTLLDDLHHLVGEEAPTAIVMTNMRRAHAVLTHPTLRSRAAALGLLSLPHLAHHVFHYLFRPSPFLLEQVARARSRTFANPERPYIGLHFRAGDQSPEQWKDPPRHRLDQIGAFLRCAAHIESDLGLPADTQWFLSADTWSVLNVTEVSGLRTSGKLVVHEGSGQLVHIDRSSLQTAALGAVDAFVNQQLLAAAVALVASRSYFGETAAEVIGGVRHVYYWHGCFRIDLTAS